MLAHTEQIRAQHLTDEQVGQLVRQTPRSCTKAARAQATPSACASTSTKHPAAAAAAAMRRARRASAAVTEVR